MAPLQTERLTIRPFVESDVGELYQLVYANPLVRDTWSGIVRPLSSSEGASMQIRYGMSKMDLDFVRWYATEIRHCLG
jgi:RimJ/RimL family protein N-acetyltransferase